MAYYRNYYRPKQKRPGTIAREKAIKESKKIVLISKLGELSIFQLEFQKKKYLEDNEELNSIFSSEYYLNKIKEYNEHIAPVIVKLNDLDISKINLKSYTFYEREFYIKRGFFSDIGLLVFKNYIKNSAPVKSYFDRIVEFRKFLHKIHLKNTDLCTYFHNVLKRIKFEINLNKFQNIGEYKLKTPNIFSSDNYHTIASKLDRSFFDIYQNSFIENLKSKYSLHDPYGHLKYRLIHCDYSFEYLLNCKKKITDTLLSNFEKCSESDVDKNSQKTYLLFTNETNFQNLNDTYKEFLNSYEIDKLPPPTILEPEIASVYFSFVKDFNNKMLRKIELLIRAKTKSKAKIENVGYVYVLSNKAYPEIYKIGSTYGIPEERAEELTGTGHLHPFEVEISIEIESAEYYEKILHELLNGYRVKQNREFFKIEIGKLKNILKEVSNITFNGKKKIKSIELKKEIKI
jgi:hypothetical protein